MFILIRISSRQLLKRAGWQLIWESNPPLPNQLFGSTLTTALMASQNSREFNFHWEDGTPKSVMKHVSWAVGLVRIFPHLYCHRGSHFHQDHLEICAKWTKLIFISLEDWFHISQRWFEPILPLLCWTELLIDEAWKMKNVLDQNFASVIVSFISPVHWFHISQQDIGRYNGAKMCQLNHDLVKVKESFIFLLYFQKHVLLSLWRLHNVHIIITIDL